MKYTVRIYWLISLFISCLTLPAMAGGYFRVVNDAAADEDAPSHYAYTIRFHRAPWTTRPRRQRFPGTPIAPGEASDWLHLPSLHRRTAPLTMEVLPGRTTPNARGVVQFASSPSEDAILRTFPITSSAGITVESSRAAFTKADHLRSDYEIEAETLRIVQAMNFKGRAPQRFPTGPAGGRGDQLIAGRLLGFTTYLGRGTQTDRERMDHGGFQKLYATTHWLGQWNQGGGGYQRDKNAEEALRHVTQWREAGLEGRIGRISIRDEASLDVRGRLFGRGMERDLNYWPQVIALAGLQPSDFIDPDAPPPPQLTPDDEAYWKHLRGFSREERESHPEGVYNTMKVLQSIWPLRFKNYGSALKEAYGDDLPITANIHMSAYFRDNFSGLDPWMVYSRHRALDIPQVCDYLVSWPQQEEWLIDLQRSAQRPYTEHPVDAMLQAQERYMPRPPRHLEMCAMSALGAGARSLTFYIWGPRYLATENWYDTDPERLKVVGRVNHAVGWVEDILLDGAPPHGDVAILYSRPSELWDRLAPSSDIESPGSYLAERRIVYHLLRGKHRQVDFIHDEVLPEEQGVAIDRYGVIFMSQRCITDQGAKTVLDWVRRGGTLVGMISVGQFDELEQPQRTMLDAFGIQSMDVQFTSGEQPKTLPDHNITLRNEQAMWGRVIPAPDTTVLARFDDGNPAILQRDMGQGSMIYVAFGLGNAYHRMSGERSELGRELRLLTGMQDSVRELIKPWLKNAGTPASRTDHPLISARLIASEDASAVFLINSTGQENMDKVSVHLRGVSARQVTSLEQGPLDFKSNDQELSFSLPMGLTDVIRIEH